jgi:polyisoprenoid-binding protein YceI
MKIGINAILLIVIAIAGYCQEKYFTKSGKVTFYSKAPLEDIEAKNNNAVSVLDKSTAQVEVSILMKAFEFEKALMQEHFNENYVESDKFPKSIFKGTIDNLAAIDFAKDGTYNTTVAGKLTLHGETKDISAPVILNINNGKLSAASDFKIRPEDFKISIPVLVRDKIGKEIRIMVEINYEVFKR